MLLIIAEFLNDWLWTEKDIIFVGYSPPSLLLILLKSKLCTVVHIVISKAFIYFEKKMINRNRKYGKFACFYILIPYHLLN